MLVFLTSTLCELEYNQFLEYNQVVFFVLMPGVCAWSTGIQPDGIIGHSVGELGCAYADGSFTAAEAIKAAYCRGRSGNETVLLLVIVSLLG